MGAEKSAPILQNEGKKERKNEKVEILEPSFEGIVSEKPLRLI